MSPVMSATVLLLGSNVFMTFAWYAHLKNLAVYFVFRSPGTT